MERKVVFLDRDGVINRERGEHTWLPADLEILPNVPRALRELKRNGWGLVVITNQSGIGLGMYDHEHVRVLHDRIGRVLQDEGVGLDDIFYCPHHPQQGRCLCRKPGSLLFERAIARTGADPARSVMIGDRQRDLDAARAVGVRGLLIEANSDLLPLLRKEKMI